MGALSAYFRQPQLEPELFNDDAFNTLIEDFYTFEAISGMTQSTGQILLSSNKTTSSLSFVDVPEASFSHIFRKPNISIEWHNVHVTNAGTLTVTLIRAVVVGLTPDEEMEGRGLGTEPKILTTKSIYIGIDTEATYTVKLQF